MAAHKGSGHFRWMRWTSIALLPLTVFFVLVMVSLVGADHQTARRSLALPVIWLPLLALVLAGTWHMWLGMQVIIDDYARGGVRSTLHLLSTLFAIAVLLAAFGAIYRLSIGG